MYNSTIMIHNSIELQRELIPWLTWIAKVNLSFKDKEGGDYLRDLVIQVFRTFLTFCRDLKGKDNALYINVQCISPNMVNKINPSADLDYIWKVFKPKIERDKII